MKKGFHIPRSKLFWSVGFGHFTNDFFGSMASVLLTFLATTVMPMTNTEIGLALSMAQIVGSVSQPFFGLQADRTGGRWIGALSQIWGVSFLMISIFVAITTKQYWLMFIPFVIRTLGSGIIHPVGALHVAESDRKNTASNTAYFFFLGQLGLALGPAIAGLLLDATNPNPNAESVVLTPIFLLGLAAIPSVVMMARYIPREPYATEKVKKKTGVPTQTTRQVLPAVILALIVILRSLGQPGSVAFIPVLFESKGWTPAEYGLITSFFWIASGISGIVFGQLADRFDRRYVMMASMVLSAPAFFLLPSTDGLVAFALAIIAGGFSGGAHSIIVVLAQSLIPASKGFASGAIVGFIFASGAIGSLIIGRVSDSIGLETTFQIVAGFILVAGLMAMFLPAGKQSDDNTN